MESGGIDHVLARARRGLQRLTAVQAHHAVRRGALIVDTRPEFQRAADGEIPEGIVVERNHLEWRLDPLSPHRIQEAAAHDIHWIVLCDEGYSSSLAAASLRLLGLARATDVIGGFQSWRTSGLPVVHSSVPTSPRRPGT
ncbi:rhodanese-like domain-containing protein [Planotetraspora kaengkrachanensis]|uniref:Sulfurtransferase n=1 Tax=Planotetraspora kaengkrachanensis TaxID=575193 RepID=A0A8J3M1S0_9ACTN|nr:rhodanese-like domain-containing protein [Planotetraspora kaengkrachanensis]GIG77769.1 sulfurtransferase [Planotetraspora kaengkrachanensis]